MYGLLGSCGQVTIGPCAISSFIFYVFYGLVSMMCGSAVSFLDPSQDFHDYVSALMTMSFVGGLFLFLLGLFRLGAVTAIMSETVITAFTAGSAFNIAASQLKHFWGVKTEKDSFLFILLDIFTPEQVRNSLCFSLIE